MTLINQPTSRTNRKVDGATLGAAIGPAMGAALAHALEMFSTLSSWLAFLATSEWHALAMILGGIAGTRIFGYWTRERKVGP